MKNNVFFAIALRIIILFTIVIMGTFLPEILRDFFGDAPQINTGDAVDPLWSWGPRHYWYFTMMVFLFILGCTNVIIGIVNIVKKNYDTSKW